MGIKLRSVVLVLFASALMGCGTLRDREEPIQNLEEAPIESSFDSIPSSFTPDSLPFEKDVNTSLYDVVPFPDQTHTLLATPQQEHELIPTPHLSSLLGTHQAYIRQKLHALGPILLDLEALVSQQGVFPYTQTLSLGDGHVDLVQDTTQSVVDALFFPNAFENDLFTYALVFDQGVPVLRNPFQDFASAQELSIKGGDVSLLGNTYFIAQAVLQDSSVLLNLLRKDVNITSKARETRRYDFLDKTYEIMVNTIQNGKVYLEVNGESIEELSQGQAYTLRNGAILALTQVFSQGQQDYARFVLSEKNVVLHDDDITDTAHNKGVTINDVPQQALVRITGRVEDDQVTLETLDYKARAFQQQVLVRPGKTLREGLDDVRVLLGLDVRYNALTNSENGVEQSPVIFDGQKGNGFDMTFTNTVGKTFTFPLVTFVHEIAKWGSESSDFIFTEGLVHTTLCTHPSCDAYGNFFNIDQGDYFAVTSEDKVTEVLRYQFFDTVTGKLFFETSKGGMEVNTRSSSLEGILAQSEIALENGTFALFVGQNAKNSLVVDLDENGIVKGERADLMVQGGGKVSFTDQGGLAQIADQYSMYPLEDYGVHQDGTTLVRLHYRNLATGLVLEEDMSYFKFITEKEAYDYNPQNKYESILFMIRKMNDTVQLFGTNVISVGRYQTELVDNFLHKLEQEKSITGLANYGTRVTLTDYHFVNSADNHESRTSQGSLLIQQPLKQVFGIIDVSVGKK
jgi:hypothetical protein